MDTRSKRFQSGHEIFKEYIPDYNDSKEDTIEKTRPNSDEDATDLAATLLREFDSQLNSKV